MLDFQKISKQPALLIRGIISLFYIGFAVYLFFHLYTLGFVQLSYRPLLAAGIFLYGAYRLYRFIVEAKEL